MPLDDMHPSFAGVHWVLALALMLYAVVGPAVLDRRVLARVCLHRLRRRHASPGTEPGTHRVTEQGTVPTAVTAATAAEAAPMVPGLISSQRWRLAVQWTVLALVAAVVVAAPGVSGADVGWAWPRRDRLEFALLLAVTTVALVTFGVGIWRRRVLTGRHVPGPFQAAAFCGPVAWPARPRRLEQVWALASAAVAAVHDEVLYRGLLTAAAVGILGFTVDQAALASMAVFVVANVHRGRVRVVAAAGLAVVSTLSYLETSSLLLPIALHAALNVHNVISLQAVARSMTPAQLHRVRQLIISDR
ncbi:type II CAAX prenyl endopeptidase Rce1 family protein [Actinomadura sp. 6N118]|uniref:CPBP family glutamic-type intramembrane protease n=1 Tax=Actinomadura sp. 6N118 TaxID=3375151 RepID=UPI0037B0BAC4